MSVSPVACRLSRCPIAYGKAPSVGHETKESSYEKSYREVHFLVVVSLGYQSKESTPIVMKTGLDFEKDANEETPRRTLSHPLASQPHPHQNTHKSRRLKEEILT
eukprot:gene27268-biopygen7942